MKITQLLPKESVLAELGRRLAKYRKHHGLNQERLAADAGIGVATLRRIEEGRDAQLGSWIKILIALGDSDTIDSLLPENLRSPMADVKGKTKPSAAKSPLSWGDEQ
jgi:transcriptional regulator with XRE-family HTH domain